MKQPVCHLVERKNAPVNGQFTFESWMPRSSIEWAERTRKEFAGIDLVIVEIVGDFEYRIT